MGKHIYANQKVINSEIKRMVYALAKEPHLKFIFEKDFLDPLLQFLTTVIQNSFKVCQKGNDFDEVSKLHELRNLSKPLWDKLQKEIQAESTRGENAIINSLCDFDLSDLTQTRKLYLALINQHLMVLFHPLHHLLNESLNQLSKSGMQMSHNFLHRLEYHSFNYLHKVLYELCTHDGMDDLAKAIDRRYLAREYKEIRVLSSNTAMKKHISKLPIIRRLTLLIFSPNELYPNNSTFSQRGPIATLIGNEYNFRFSRILNSCSARTKRQINRCSSRLSGRYMQYIGIICYAFFTGNFFYNNLYRFNSQISFWILLTIFFILNVYKLSIRRNRN